MSDVDDLSGGDDLFGSDAEDNDIQERAGLVDAAKDDDDIMNDESEEEVVEEEKIVRKMEAEIAPPKLPRPSDGQLHTLRIPQNYLRFDANAFTTESFKPAKQTVEEKGEAVEKNDFDNSINTIRYRVKDGKLQGNTLLNKWSDGSYTLSIGDEIFELLPNPLAPPRTEAYQALLDSHQYVGVPYGAGSLMQIVGHLTNEFKVSPSERIRKKEAARILEKARTAGRSSNAAHGGIAILTKVEDPELQRKKAEVAEREQARNARRLESARSKQDGHSSRIRGAMGGGLTLDDLEGRSRPSASKTKRAAPAGRRKPRREDYDTDDEMPRGRNREDEYDMEDDFLVDDEDEEEAAETGESEEEEEYERHSPKAKKQKREATPLSDEDAEGEEDEGAVPISSAPTTQGGRARRQVIDSDDDE